MNSPHFNPLYILRFDHRTPFLKGLFGIEQGQILTSEQRLQVVDLKMLIYEGLVETLSALDVVDRQQVVAVIDEEFGFPVIQDARSQRIPIAISVERSGRDEFEFEYGDEFAAHIDRLKPNFVKALARYNPGRDQELNDRQRRRLAELSEWTTENGYQLMFELLIPPTEEQLASLGGDSSAYERELLIDLVNEVFDSFEASDIRAAIWMVPGFPSSEICTRAASELHQKSPGARCVVLGQGPDAGQVTEWIRVAKNAQGYDGIAVAQTIWMPALRAYLTHDVERQQARQIIAKNFRAAIQAFG